MSKLTLIDKEECDCGEMAVWIYMPSSSNHTNPYYCDNCVPRGCSCNYHWVGKTEYDDLPPDGVEIKWITDGVCWTDIDDEGREYPCTEYDYCEDGFDKE